jgi:signal transduction histidine kinase
VLREPAQSEFAQAVTAVTIPAALIAWSTLAVLDWVTSFELYLSAFYLILVLVVAWHHGLKWAILFSVLSVANQLAIGIIDGNPYSSRIYFAVDILNWFLAYLVAGWMCARIKALNLRLVLDAEELDRLVKERTTQLETLGVDLEDFAYTVAHDLRAPARHVAAFAQLIRDRLKSADSTVWNYLLEISKATTKMDRLINDLLGLSYASRTEFQVEAVNLNTIIANARDDCALQCADRQIEWKIADLPTVMGDPGLLRLVFANLVSNAIKFTARRAPAHIELDSEAGADNEVVIRVTDDGVGFDPRYQSKLFKVFQRLHKDSDFSGTGIGLATVRRVIERHGGRVWAEGKQD